MSRISIHTKVGLIGTGAVGRASALAISQRGACRELVLIDENRAAAEGVATDLPYARAISAPVEISDGDYGDLAGAGLVLITAGVNEKTGGADDPDDSLGRLRLLPDNAQVYRDIVPRVAAAAPEAVIAVITDPPDPLADIARELAGHDRVFSAGTYIDSLRLRFHIARELGVSPETVDAQVIGEHGKSSVPLWSTASVGGLPVAELFRRRGQDPESVQAEIERAVSGANITIIEGIGASQFGVGVVVARLTEAVVRDERLLLPVGTFQPEYGLTLSLPSVLGADGVSEVIWPALSDAERAALDHSAEVLKEARARADRGDL